MNELELWKARANAMLAIVQAAQAVSNIRKPWRMYDLTGRTGDELMPSEPLDRLDTALEAYRAMAESEATC